VLIVREARTGGFRDMDEPSGASAPGGRAGLGVGRLLANAALITTIGFILSCTLCYVLAVQGLRRAQGQAARHRASMRRVTGLLISAPVFWMFTKFLAINLPGLTGTAGSDMDIFNALLHGFATAISPSTCCGPSSAACSAPPSACCPASARRWRWPCCCRSRPRWTSPPR
jgi:hypothetical protein